uniref:F-box domain-containing protein n=1 Tax=Meloidogyne enterolobii TaxID=390850 RepID=A0A6V7VMR6_MELEN|nr:unnamed protein product [Meloidogyne enterolobii]
MLFLPHEVQLDVLKCCNFEQLFSLKQTNFYFRNLINQYEGELARIEFSKLSLIDTLSIGRQLRNTHKIVELEPVVSDFALNGQLMKKWKAAIAESVPLFLRGHDDFVGDFVVQMEKTENKKPLYILNLPNTAKTIEEMIIFRFWLEQLFNCAFELALFANIFNPTMINLLFDDYKAISFQFHIQKACIDTSNAKFENFLKLGLNRFTIYNNFVVTLEVISEQQTNILFNIITNEGKKLPRISFCYCDSSRLYDLIIQVIFKNGTLCLHRPSPYFGQPNRQNSSILLYLYCVSRICYK